MGQKYTNFSIFEAYNFAENLKFMEANVLFFKKKI